LTRATRRKPRNRDAARLPVDETHFHAQPEDHEPAEGGAAARRVPRPAAPQLIGPAGEKDGARILVIEDDPAYREQLKVLLAVAGYKVKAAAKRHRGDRLR
jgi:PleD family two-component response regulator